MQEIDASFDEKDLGMSKFSRFCTEAAHKGLLKVTKLENGQMEVAPPAEGGAKADKPASSRAVKRPAAAEPVAGASEAEAAPAPAEAAEEGAAPPEREGRPRRGRRGGRGRKREETPGAEAPPAEHAETAPVGDVAAEVQHELPAETRRPRRPRAESAPETNDGIGVAGTRLTRDEAMQLVRGAVAALTLTEDAVPDALVRQKAFELLGRDSESLSVRHFSRILRDAHDSDIIDLRRRGDAFEVARAAAAASVADQLAEREQEAKAAEPQAPTAAPAQRGMGARGAGAGRSGRGGSRAAPPADLLMVGVVEENPAE
jgi:hypothetical protein